MFPSSSAGHRRPSLSVTTFPAGTRGWECQTGPVRKLVIALVILAALLIAADFGSRAYAESRAATAVQGELGMASTPDVSIEGFPFLLHAVRGEYPQVIVTATDVSSQLPGTRAIAELSTVALPLREVINQDTSAMTARSTRLQLLVPVTSLSDALGRPDVTLSAGPDGSLAVTATVSIAGLRVPLTGTASVTVSENTLTVATDSLTAAGVDVTPAITAAVDTLVGGLRRSFTLTGLPFTITGAEVSVASGDVVITGTTGPVSLAQLRAAATRGG